MFDRDLIIDMLLRINTSLENIIAWTTPLNSPDEFLTSNNGLIVLNAVCMQLLAIGEAVKSLDKRTNKSLLSQYPTIRWKDIMGLRDIIAHHYFEVEADKIFDAAKIDVPLLLQIVKQILSDLQRKN